MPVIIPQQTVPVPNASAEGLQADHADASQITEDLVSRVADRVMALLLQDLKFERERRRAVAHSDRLKGVR